MKALDQYDFIQICTRPASNSWSLGQVAMHLLADTNFYLEQIRICLSTNAHSLEEASPAARTMFQNNDFPDEMIAGAPANAYIGQPESKAQLIQALLNLKQDIRQLEGMIDQSPCKGKTKHPGLGYFSAAEWLQFADMHFRHHLRQKKRIDYFLAQATPE